MTAPIVDHWRRRVVADPERDCSAVDWNDADLTEKLRDEVPRAGQLWERLAEQSEAVL